MQFFKNQGELMFTFSFYDNMKINRLHNNSIFKPTVKIFKRKIGPIGNVRKNE